MTLLAQIETIEGRGSAVASWLSVMSAAADGDPILEQGRAALRKVAGLTRGPCGERPANSRLF